MHYNLTAYVLLIILKCFYVENYFLLIFLRFGIEAHDSLVEALVTEAWRRLERQVLWVLQLRSGLFFSGLAQ